MQKHIRRRQMCSKPSSYT